MKIERKNKFRLGILAALAVMFGTRLFSIKLEQLAFTNSIIAVFVWIAIWYILIKACERIDFSEHRENWIASVFALCFSTALCWGAELEKGDGIPFGDFSLLVAIVVWSIVFCILTKLAFHILSSFEEVKDRKVVFYGKKQLICIYIGFVLCWIPTFLAVYPGFFLYDAQDELNEVLTRTFTNHHPLTHVILLGGVIAAVHKVTDSFNLGIAVYMVLQMLFMAGCFTYVMYFLKKHGVRKWVRITSFLWFAFFPVIPMYVFCSTKDSLFTAALVVQLLLLYEFIKEKEAFLEKRSKVVALFFFSVLMMLFRHNGFYAYAIWAVLWMVQFSVFCYQKKKNRMDLLCGENGIPDQEEEEEKDFRIPLFDQNAIRRILLIFGPMVLFFLMHKAIIFGLHAESNEYQEMLTVPIMQLTRVYERQPEDFTPEQKNMLLQFLPEEAMEHYSPKLSDHVKMDFNNGAYQTNSKDFWVLWASIGRHHVGGYLNAWFYTSFGLWYPDTVIDAYEGIQRYTFRYGESSFFGYETELPGTRNSKILWIDDFYRVISLEVAQQRIPLIAMLFSPGFFCWCYLFGACYLFRMKNWNLCLILGLILLLWMTVLLGPTSMVRYVLIFWFFFPVLCSIIGKKVTGWLE